MLFTAIWLFCILQAAPTLGQAPAAAEDLRQFKIPETDEGLPGSGPIRRYQWFRELWEQRRSEWSTRVETDQHAIVFLGDSITQGWGNDFKGRFPGLKAANRGISGDTTRGMLIRLEEDVLALNPAGLILLAGTNDLEEGATPEVIAGNIELILSELKRHNPQMPIILCRVFPSSAEKKRPREQIQAVNKLYAEAIRDNPQVTMLDTWTLFANAEGDAKMEEFPDLLHPNDLGYAKWAASLRPLLATAGFIETEADQQSPEAGFEPLFNGKDLSGWGFRPTSKEDIAARNRWQASDPDAAEWPIITEATNLDGRQVTDDGRFLAKSGRLVVTTPSEGRRIQQLWTQQEFDTDFVLKLEFRATPNADSGIFIRGTQLQCRDYALAGPYKALQNYKPQDWNEIIVTVKGNVARATCNGELLEEALTIPPSGPIGLEGDRGQVEYRRIRIEVLP
ncbi:MAG: DUF1080 domain-containing protein [Acidobacteriota bacterium]|nr:MAG: DUF1080 domain-containing protein [Acidobacteriota bacterium]